MLVQELPLTATAPTEERLGGLFDAHHLRIHKLGLRMLGDVEEARDLVQETFLRAARTVARVPAEEPAAEAWLVRIAVNLCRDRHRRRAVRRPYAAPMPREVAGGDDEERSHVARGTIRTALLALPPRRRAIVVLHEIEGRSTAEIATLLGTRPVTVRWHLAIGRRELARALRPALETGAAPEGTP